ncbi:TetR/AcrR family transcriptional regulator [Nocardia bovistercoris]|uniref:TetR/AcrR family transcriptional regulator n=1 Tax=Nocardia bovistercoris TaxID=2785916 RepID=A0A931IE82_9NOCA|nr:TetR/AcrR family transcriptional regulator [Nocardia bovistercoris]MBH0778487.1 TetR/AcrR family transcriptional regulator [Nocardia bovistercoris]
MPSPRRIGAPDAKNRGLLVDAAQELLLEEGWAAVTSRRVAERAGLKPQLVHYYFRSMDELLLEIFRRAAEAGLILQADMMKTDRPLRALWDFSIDPTAVRFTMEFVGLSNHRPEIRAAVAEYAEQFRTIQTNALETLLKAYGFDTERFPAAAMAVLITSISRVVVFERELGMAGGHSEIFDLVEREIDRIEGTPAASDSDTA